MYHTKRGSEQIGGDFAAFPSGGDSMKCFDLYFSRAALTVQLAEYTKTI